MKLETKATLAALIAGLSVVGASYGVSALVVRAHGAEDGPKASPPARSAPGAGVPVVNAALVTQGHAFYTQSCASCHGASGGGGYGPSLHHEDMTDARITATINKGVPGKMPGFASRYDAGQTQALVAYIRSLK